MIQLNNANLRRKLNEIDSNKQIKEQYDSKLNRILNFLRSNTGLKNAGVKKSGSRAKGTSTRRSDMEVNFCTSPDQDHNKIRNHLKTKAIEQFGKVAKVKIGKKAVHIDFNSPKLYFDVVYMTQRKFQQESEKIKKIKQLSYTQKNAIKLTKYTLSKAKITNVKSYEVELTCLNFNSNDLADCTFRLIKYFTGRIKQKGKTLNSVLQRLN